MNTHQQLRAALWCNVATGIAVIPDVIKKEVPSEWADHILKDFDKRFPEPQSPVDNDHSVSMLKAELEILNADRDGLRAERETLLRWKKEQLEMNRRWTAVDEFVRQHPSTGIGKFIDSEAIRLMRERDMFRSQLRNADIHPRPLL